MAIAPLKLPDESALPLILDASVVINVIATGCGSAVLAALNRPLVVVDHVVDELEDGRNYGRQDADALAALVVEGRIRRVSLADSDASRFTGLVTGPSIETLDDGEAATIAFAVGSGGIAVIDERKATRICAERFPTLFCKSTVDLLMHPDVESHLSRVILASAVYNALKAARMRVPHQHVDWVVALIGRERAAECPSLPRSSR